jgi:hypothetical protein
MRGIKYTCFIFLFFLHTSCDNQSNAPAGNPGNPAQENTSNTLQCAQAVYKANASCTFAQNDYSPIQNDTWPACISDDNQWHYTGQDMPAASARSQAFENMAALLWNNPQTPSAEDFLAARDMYSTPSGIASRVARRQDISYPEIPGENKFACAEQGVPEQYPNRCVGPAQLQPLINDAFQKGLAQEKPFVQAMRIKAALLWFFYVSTTSEVWTCSFDDIADCDSSIGYYTQVSTREDPKGLAAYIARNNHYTHQRIYDALLAVRCWRDLHPELPTPTTTPAYQNASAQLQRAGLHGMALLLREHAGYLACTQNTQQEGYSAFVNILGGFLQHAVQSQSPSSHEAFTQYTTNPVATPEAVASFQNILDTVFACP